MIAIAMTRTKCTKRTRNRYFTSWRIQRLRCWPFMETLWRNHIRDWKTSSVAMNPLFVMRTSFILTSELKSLRLCRQCWKSFSVKNQERISESPIAGIRIKMKRPKKWRVKCVQHEFARETCQFVILLFLLKIYSDALPFLESCGHGGKDFPAPPVSA